MNLNDKKFIKKEREIYKEYRKANYSVKFAWFKAFHATIDHFKSEGVHLEADYL